jgi:hypothetical protein
VRICPTTASSAARSAAERVSGSKSARAKAAGQPARLNARMARAARARSPRASGTGRGLTSRTAPSSPASAAAADARACSQRPRRNPAGAGPTEGGGAPEVSELDPTRIAVRYSRQRRDARFSRVPTPPQLSTQRIMSVAHVVPLGRKRSESSSRLEELQLIRIRCRPTGTVTRSPNPGRAAAARSAKGATS